MPFAFPVPSQVHGILSTITFLDALDICVVAIILYKFYEMLENTRAITLVKGLLVLLTVSLACNFLNLHVMSWLLQKIVTLLFVALPIVFQPELRRALEHIGQGRFFGAARLLEDEARTIVDELARAVSSLSKTKTGALIVIERSMGLNDISASGIQIDGIITADFMLNVFIPNTPLHDGAVVIRGNRLVSAGCLLPLTDNRALSTELGTRHRAAIGLSEQSDALIIVVSEETGTISIAENGHLTRYLDITRLKAMIAPAFASPNEGFMDMVMNWRKKE